MFRRRRRSASLNQPTPTEQSTDPPQPASTQPPTHPPLHGQGAPPFVPSETEVRAAWERRKELADHLADSGRALEATTARVGATEAWPIEESFGPGWPDDRVFHLDPAGNVIWLGSAMSVRDVVGRGGQMWIGTALVLAVEAMDRSRAAQG